MQNNKKEFLSILVCGPNNAINLLTEVNLLYLMNGYNEKQMVNIQESAKREKIDPLAYIFDEETNIEVSRACRTAKEFFTLSKCYRIMHTINYTSFIKGSIDGYFNANVCFFLFR